LWKLYRRPWSAPPRHVDVVPSAGLPTCPCSCWLGSPANHRPHLPMLMSPYPRCIHHGPRHPPTTKSLVTMWHNQSGSKPAMLSLLLSVTFTVPSRSHSRNRSANTSVAYSNLITLHHSVTSLLPYLLSIFVIHMWWATDKQRGACRAPLAGAHSN
jgi:hypothetical protein